MEGGGTVSRLESSSRSFDMMNCYNLIFRYKNHTDVVTRGLLVIGSSERSVHDACTSLRVQVARVWKVAVNEVALSPLNLVYPRLLTSSGEKEIDWCDIQSKAPKLDFKFAVEKDAALSFPADKDCYYLAYFLHSSDDMVARNVAIIKAKDIDFAWVVVKPYMEHMFVDRVGFSIGHVPPLVFLT